jgi:hypothetical protein
VSGRGERERAYLKSELIHYGTSVPAIRSVAKAVASQHPERHAEACAVLDRWAGDQDFWIRRAALPAFLAGLRRGEGDFERFSRYADAMLEDQEFFVPEGNRLGAT